MQEKLSAMNAKKLPKDVSTLLQRILISGVWQVQGRPLTESLISTPRNNGSREFCGKGSRASASRHGRESRRTGVTKDKTGIFEQRSWHKSTYDSLYIIAQIFCKANKLPCLCYLISIADRGPVFRLRLGNATLSRTFSIRYLFLPLITHRCNTYLHKKKQI